MLDANTQKVSRKWRHRRNRTQLYPQRIKNKIKEEEEEEEQQQQQQEQQQQQQQQKKKKKR